MPPSPATDIDAPHEREVRIACVILAAGRATRMGEPKSLLPLRGKPILQHVLDAALAASFDQRVLVLGHAVGRVRSTLRRDVSERLTVLEADPARSAAGHSLALGLRACREEIDAAMILLADQPDVDAALIGRVAAAYRRSTKPALRPYYGSSLAEHTPGHPVVLGRSIWSLLLQNGEDSGAGPLLDQHPEWVERLELEGPAPADIDTPADYRRAGGAPGGPEA